MCWVIRHYVVVGLFTVLGLLSLPLAQADSPTLDLTQEARTGFRPTLR